MNWQCQLYGHQWRHTGTYQVVISEANDPAHPVQCAICETEHIVTTSGILRPSTGTEHPSVVTKRGFDHLTGETPGETFQNSTR